MYTKRRRGRPPHDDVLTPAEWRVVDAVRHGLTNREIAERRGVSLDAVKYHVANAIAKLGLGRRSDLRHWPGSPKSGALPPKEKRMETKLEFSGLGQVARTVADISVSVAWYRDVLGLRHLFTFDKIAFFDLGGTRLMLSQAETPQVGESILYLRVSDIDAAFDELGKRGVKFLGAPHMIHRHEDGTEEWMAFFDDPEQRPLAIMATARP